MFKCNKFWHGWGKGKSKNTGGGWGGPGCGGFFYFLGFLGALAYYWTTAPNIWAGVVGFFQALFWPAFLVYGLMFL